MRDVLPQGRPTGAVPGRVLAASLAALTAGQLAEAGALVEQGPAAGPDVVRRAELVPVRAQLHVWAGRRRRRRCSTCCRPPRP